MVLVAPTRRLRTLVCLAPEQNIRVPPLVMRMLRVRALVPIDNSLTVTSTPTCRVDQTSTPTCRVDHTSNTARMGWKRGAKHETTRSYTETVRACALAQCAVRARTLVHIGDKSNGTIRLFGSRRTHSTTIPTQIFWRPHRQVPCPPPLKRHPLRQPQQVLPK